jgi:maltose alpha-D-glucosyltransferase / alpha-amylase
MLPSRFRAELAKKLAEFLRAQRWFGGKALAIRSTQIVEAVPVNLADAAAEILLVEVTYETGARETYALPLLALRSGEKLEAGTPALEVNGDGGAAVFCDALWDRRFRACLLETIAGRRTLAGSRGEIRAVPTGALERLWDPKGETPESSLMRAEQSNTSLVYGDRLVLKFYRRLEEGVNPDLEIGTFLTEKASFAFIPPVAGRLEYVRPQGASLSMAILQGYVRNQGDAWRYTLKCLQEFWARLPASQPKGISYWDFSDQAPPVQARELVGTYLDSAQLLGRRTAQLHRALASDAADPDFVPEEFTPAYMRSLCDFMQGLARRVLPLLRNHLEALPADAAAPARELLRQEARIFERFGSLGGLQPTALRTRLHGDYHLGQVLYTGEDFVIIDFEGEPARSLSERRVKRSPLRDVAGMLRSFHYAASTGLYDRLAGQEAAGKEFEPWARWWNAQVSRAFLRAYLAESAGACFLPRTRQELEKLLSAYLLEKAVYELGYELNNRPTWVRIPLEGILQLLRPAA